MMTFLIDSVDEDKQPFRDRLRQEMSRWDYTVQEWSVKTGIARGTLDNMLLPNRKGSITVGYLNAFWKAEPSIDLHYIITGERSAAKVYIRTEGQVDIITDTP